MGQKFILTAFGKDRPGIVADATEVLFELGCNLEDSSMTLLGGEFTLILLFQGPEAVDIEEKVRTALRRLEREKGLSAFLRPADASAERPEARALHTIHVEGEDQAGIVYRVSRFLADLGINIVDLTSKRSYMPQSGSALYTMEIRVEIPKAVSLDTFDKGLSHIGEALNVDVTW